MTLKYFRSIALGFVLSCLGFFIAASIQVNAPTPTSQWIYDLYIAKKNIAQELSSPKLVVAAGSNAMVGISCWQIQQETGTPCLNGAINVGLGLDYILHQARSFLASGDTVLLPLEYELYESSMQPSSVAIDYVFARDFGYWQSTDYLTKMRFLFGLGFKRTLMGLIHKLSQPASEFKSVNRLQSIDRAGDWIKNRPQDLTPDHQRRLLLLHSYQGDQLRINDRSRQKIAEFISWCNEHQVEVLATWPNTLEYPEYQQPQYQGFFASIKAFYHEQNVALIGEPEDYMYDRSLLFDSTYHLNARGVAIRTAQLIESLSSCQPNSAAFCLAKIQD